MICTGAALATGLGAGARSSMAEAIRVFCWLYRRGTSRQKVEVPASSAVETTRAPPLMRTVVFSRALPHTCTLSWAVIMGRGSSTGAVSGVVFFTAGVPGMAGRSVPSRVRVTSTAITPSARPQASMPSKATVPAPSVAG